MSANVETMMYTREKPWHGLGTRVEEAPTSADALRLAGLDWTVEQKPVFLEGQDFPIANYNANVRDKDGKVLGIVTDRYRIVQNAEAFAWTDELLGGGDVRYETAGSLREGRSVWLLAKMPPAKVAGDEVEPYVVFSNTHDGSGAIRVAMTPVRVVCNNTLNLALRTAQRSWSTKHVGDLQYKLAEAQRTLELANRYMIHLDRQAQQLANVTVTDAQLEKILNEMFPCREDATERQKNTVKAAKDEFMVCWFMPDLDRFRGTAWGVVNAMADMVDHSQPRRNTQNYRENNWGRIMNGHELVDRVTVKMLDMVGGLTVA